jgi:CHD5-like protein
MGSIPLLVQLICFSCCSAFLPSVVKWVNKNKNQNSVRLNDNFFYLCQIMELNQKKSSDEQQLLSDLRDMKKELAQISMVDEFARHAKLQRKITKSQEDLKKISEMAHDLFNNSKL